MPDEIKPEVPDEAPEAKPEDKKPELESFTQAELADMIRQGRKENAARRLSGKDLTVQNAALEKIISDRADADKVKSDADLVEQAKYQQLAEERAAELALMKVELAKANATAGKFTTSLEAEETSLKEVLGEDTAKGLGLDALPLESRVSVMRTFKAKLDAAQANAKPTPGAPAPTKKGGSVSPPGEQSAAVTILNSEMSDYQKMLALREHQKTGS